MRRLTVVLLIITVIITGCMTAGDHNTENAGKTDDYADFIPEDIEKNESGVPLLKVHIAETDEIQKLDIETYLMGVVAGEMKNDWPIEALKAQAILARTFTLKFLNTKESAYEGADISTDISEAQAYAPDNINDRIKQAVEETKGIVMVCDDELPHAWFHAHSGGMTELPGVALDFAEEEPAYLKVKPSYDSEKAPENVKKWEKVFSSEEIGEACAASGMDIGPCRTFEIGEKGKSGRSKTFIINGKTFSAPTFRLNIGSSDMKSTLIEAVNVTDGKVTISGKGYGHGVGMSQWGAYSLAEKGATAHSIAEYYFEGVDFAGLW